MVREGRAVIQTYQPENATINFAREQNYLAFYENEIKYRKRMDYPPSVISSIFWFPAKTRSW